MIGKKNIVFGLFYLVLTAALGPYMIVGLYPDYVAASGDKARAVAELAQIKSTGYEKDLEPLAADELARLNTEALIVMNRQDMARAPIDAVKGGPHAHGNLEALLNIAAGLVLTFVAVSTRFKQAISWVFIAGALLHSGALYLRSFDIPGGATLAETGIGPVLILVGLAALGVASLMGLRPQPVDDK